jgi:aspartate aminotransferase
MTTNKEDIKMNISKRGELAPFSPIRKLTPYADKAKAEGVKVFHLNIGQPDFKIPEEMASRLKELSSTDYVPYAHSQGLKELINAWQKYLASVNIDVNPENILITTGGSEALILVACALCDPGDEILVFEPFYANYNGFANIASAKVVPVALDDKNGYHLPADEEIESKITSRTKAIFFTSPNNPSGTVFTEAEVTRLLEIASKHDLFLVCDQAYHGIAFDGVPNISAFELAGDDKDRIVIVDSLSKRLNVCGARIGAIISTNKDVMSAVNRFAQERLSVATLDQEMVIPALSDCGEYIKMITGEYQKRRDAFIGTLEKELNMKIHYPEGAFYTMVKLPVKDAETFAQWMLEKFRFENQTVMVAPGPGFYATPGKGANEIRVAYVLNVDESIKAAKILALAVKEYQKIEK